MKTLNYTAEWGSNSRKPGSCLDSIGGMFAGTPKAEKQIIENAQEDDRADFGRVQGRPQRDPDLFSRISRGPVPLPIQEPRQKHITLGDARRLRGIRRPPPLLSDGDMHLAVRDGQDRDDEEGAEKKEHLPAADFRRDHASTVALYFSSPAFRMTNPLRISSSLRT